MLRELHISNLAVIEDVVVEFEEGLNCFTGQTGAGKSLILGALEILLGGRGRRGDMVRSGADEARVTGVFEIRDEWVREQVETAIDDAPPDPDEPLLITRRIAAGGRSSVSINGRPATSTMARAVGQVLVDIHGQHDQQFLLTPANQLSVLDGFADCDAMRRRFTATHRALRDLESRRASLVESSDLRRQQLELYEFQAQEIDDVDPQAGELAELQARHRVLANLKRIRHDVGRIHESLHESEGSVVDRLQLICQMLQEMSELDESLSGSCEQVRVATLSLQENAYELRRYMDGVDLDPGELDEIEQRLNVLNRLISKYGEGGGADDPAASVLAHRDTIQDEIERLRGQTVDRDELDGQIAELAAGLEALGAELSEKRHEAALRLVPLVEAELKELGMSDARLAIELEPPSPIAQAGASGLDRLEILVAPNAGQPARPLRKIASGGELSRIMLALKSILAGADRISVLVFDEIDANIGGRL
ncbi:MAG: hypothetical protein CMJ18_24925, partial [Phycisphaeraceae bacterium]|nr:hypothetical protein [Phycisphaeraceae bacterium]